MPEDLTPAHPVRAAILGTGGVARLHAEAVAGLDGVELVGVADASLERAAEFAARHGGPSVHPDLAALLEGARPDVVHLCTPPAGHAGQAAAAFAAGADVIVEKPPALSLVEFDRMQADARVAGRRLAVVFQQRSGSAVRHVKRLLDDGALGRPLVALCETLWRRGADYYAVPWRGTWAAEGGGPTFGLAVHQLDLLAHLLGEWSEADGRFWRIANDLEMEDVSRGTIVFESGVVANAVTTTLAARETSRLRIDTELATLELEHLYGHANANWRITPAAGVDPALAATWAFPAEEEASGHDALLGEVYRAIAAGDPVPPVLADPARAFEIVTAMHVAAATGRPLRRSELADPALRGPLHAPVEVR
ncbi:Gfo/Idh/MocA family protein [Agromyces allii]|uniref:Gfo/Idh/MocA family oxidoreductase n=1 Tax=Agromyces allii TaxID=393607 RepID=A0ABP5CBR3_9MICO|nr:Gfo/Idh/MocA family oxidoreductase [Agromyces allii]